MGQATQHHEPETLRKWEGSDEMKETKSEFCPQNVTHPTVTLLVLSAMAGIPETQTRVVGAKKESMQCALESAGSCSQPPTKKRLQMTASWVLS